MIDPKTHVNDFYETIEQDKLIKVLMAVMPSDGMKIFNFMEDFKKHLTSHDKELEIFCFYMPIDFVIKRNFRNPLYDNKRASCNIYLDRKSDSYFTTSRPTKVNGREEVV